MKNTFRLLTFGLVLTSMVQLTGCAAAALGGAAAGAAGAVAYSDRGAKSDVKGDTQSINQKAEAVFSDLSIQTTGTQSKENGERELTGKSGDKEITIQMSPAANGTTHVEVVAKEGTVKWNKDYAKALLSKIVDKT
ncbi:MAG: DUF3568 family protein [Bdellovibrionia bacterium]